MYISIAVEMLVNAGFPSIVEGLRFLGLDAFELPVNREMQTKSVNGPFTEINNLSDPEQIEAYQKILTKNHLRVSSLLLANDFSRSDLDAEIAWVVHCAELASKLWADSIRIDAIMKGVEKTWSQEKRIQIFIDSMKRVLEATSKLGTHFGIENHGWQGNDPTFLDQIISAVNSPRLGNTLDTANFYWSGKPLSEVHRIIEKFVPITKHVHIKTIAYPPETRETQREMGWRYGECCCALPDGDIDIRKTVKLLYKAGYTSDLCIENESLKRFPEPERRNILRREADFLKKILNDLSGK
jgi:sugar phosphate isomerase/epimerase